MYDSIFENVINISPRCDFLLRTLRTFSKYTRIARSFFITRGANNGIMHNASSGNGHEGVESRTNVPSITVNLVSNEPDMLITYHLLLKLHSTRAVPYSLVLSSHHIFKRSVRIFVTKRFT